MPSKSLVKRLTKDYPEVTFRAGSQFKWSSSQNTLLYNPTTPRCAQLLLHELAHALLGHDAFERDVDLLKIEQIAWRYAQKSLAPRYEVTISNDDIEDSLDSYRDWLHQRSLCPDCAISGLQTKTDTYQCLACKCQWRVNDARKKALRRYVCL